jgi:hypothetical protein
MYVLQMRDVAAENKDVVEIYQFTSDKKMASVLVKRPDT